MDLIRWSGLVGIANWKLSASASAGIFSPGWEAEEKELFRLGRGNRNWGRFRNKKEGKFRLSWKELPQLGTHFPALR